MVRANEAGDPMGGSRGAITGQDGSFRLGPLRPGAQVKIATGLTDTWLASSDRVTGAHERSVTLTEAPEQEVPPLAMLRPHPLAGTVVDAAGRPVAGATVRAVRLLGGVAVRGIDDDFTTTDEDGRFRIDLPGDRFSLFVGHPDHASAALEEVASSTSLRIVLPKAGTIRGRVRRPDGTPVAAFGVEVRTTWNSAAPISAHTASGRDSSFRAPDGTFSLGGLRAMPHDLLVQTAAGEVAHATGLSPEGPVVDLVVGPAAQVEGTVVDFESGAPIEGASVALDGAGALHRVSTGADGRFVVRGAIPGARQSLKLGSMTHLVDDLVLETPRGATVVKLAPIRLVRGPQRPRRGTTGLSFERVGDRTIVERLAKKSVAARAGAEVGWELLTIDGQPAAGLLTQGVRYLNAGDAGQPIVYELRDGAGVVRRLELVREPYAAEQ
jgi:hypothetical protein